MENLFMKAIGKNDVLTENGAISNSSTGMAIVDQFGKAGNYMGRNIKDVFKDQKTIWKENVINALRFPFYLRLISRTIKINDGFITDKVQHGQGLRDESFKRLLWIAKNHKEQFYNNLWCLPIVGSWKDLFQMMFYDVEFETNCLDRKIFFQLLKEGLSYEEHSELIKKFMPRIKSKSKLTTNWTKVMNDIAKEFAKFMNWDNKTYNKFKSSGTAHEFQKQICGGMYKNINWNKIPGRALNLLVSSKFLENHNLVESYSEWLDKQPVAKYTGYVYELAMAYKNSFKNNKIPLYKSKTLDKQFDSLIETAQKDSIIKENVWCALDTSGSMRWAFNGKVTAMDICLSLGVYFSTLNKGAFHKNVIMFDNKSYVKQLNGSFTEMLSQIPMNAMGGTNFQSVVDEICNIRLSHRDIPLEDYPTTLLIVSDMQFNPSNNPYSKVSDRSITTNYKEMKNKLYSVFPKKFVHSMKFIWWDVTSRKNDFPARIEDGGCYMISGFDGSIVNLILGEDKTKKEVEKQTKTMEEMVEEALTQEILMQISLY